ncbi:protein FLUORESCENT IN BLUE LIGHT, chloroplastic-like isoform X2 [Phragmites australis]|uniref:protein FLUORESCENT IN BLUE LIGHT, chloroplastic-like isoform X2 n=1 Tax=Phragmites australis TaxID=29695 RepID=UPI002D77FD22|nr:protein FLUORESCENT IN BLUE LIGHT, chloroplastic-like isoform X2 [Phragmites australis]
MHAAVAYRCAAGHRCADASRPSPLRARASSLFPGRVRLFSGKPRGPRFYSVPADRPPLRRLIARCGIDAGVGETAAAATLCVGFLPQSRTDSGGGSGFAQLEAPDGEASRLPCALRRIIPGRQKMVRLDLLKASVFSAMSILALPLDASAETCQPANSFANMPIFIAVALIGAAVGGFLARQRKEELKRLNNQLRQINTALRRQAQIESFAPGLTYAPVGRTTETDVIVDPRKQQLTTNLRNGKNCLRNQDLDKAVLEFRTALELAESIGDHFEEKKAARGLGASLQRMGKYREAMRHYSKVLELSKETGEDSGCTEAYGAIADCYAELGDLERAAKVYDKYISRLQPGGD